MRSMVERHVQRTPSLAARAPPSAAARLPPPRFGEELDTCNPQFNRAIKREERNQP